MVRDTDPAWAHGKDVMGNRHTIECNYCGKQVNGGVTRLKQHLAHKRGQVASCQNVPIVVKKEMQALLEAGKQKKIVRDTRKEVEWERCAEEVFPDSEGEDEDPDIAAAKRESLRILHEQESLRRLQRDASARGSSFEAGGSSGATRRQPGLRRAFSMRPHEQGQGRVGGSEDEPPRQAPRRPQIVGPSDPFAYRKQSLRQPTISKALGKTLKKARDALVRATGKFFIHNNIAPNTATSPYLKTMLDAAVEHGPGFEPPTPYEIGHYCVEKEYEETQQWVATFKSTWVQRGCTIMCDGWTTITRKSLLNFLVYSHLGTIFLKSVDVTPYVKDAVYLNKLFNEVIDEIGEENVVQIVTDNDASMKRAGLMLEEQRPRIYWSPCAAHCLDLMIEDIGRKKSIAKVIDRSRKITSFLYNSNRLIEMMKKYTDGHELLRPGITRFATHFIAMESLYKYRTGLGQLVVSDEWHGSKWGKKPTTQTKEVIKTIQSTLYWKKVDEVLKVLEPLIKVLRLVDGDTKPTMGFLYEALDRAKLAIEKDCRYHIDYWNIIDNRWSNQLHHSLHAAGYFFNPQYRYAENNETNVVTDDIRKGLKNVIGKLCDNDDDACKAIIEIDTYGRMDGSFGDRIARKSINQCNPAEWWLNFGESAPTLRKVAVKVLSQTTSASNCERNWSTFSLIHTRPRNRLSMQKLNKLVYIHYNLKLRNRNRRRDYEDYKEYYCPINLDYIFSDENDPLTPWLEEVEAPVLDGDNEFAANVTNLTGEEFDPQPIPTEERVPPPPGSTPVMYTRRPRAAPAPQPEYQHGSESSSDHSTPTENSPPTGGGDGGDYGDDTVVYETVQQFPDAGHIHPGRGYMRHATPSDDDGDRAGPTGTIGEGQAGGSRSGYGGQQAMWGYNPYGVRGTSAVDIAQRWGYDIYGTYPEVVQQGSQPHAMSSFNDSTQPPVYQYDFFHFPNPTLPIRYSNYDGQRYHQQHYNDNDDDDNLEPPRHSTWY